MSWVTKALTCTQRMGLMFLLLSTFDTFVVDYENMFYSKKTLYGRD